MRKLILFTLAFIVACSTVLAADVDLTKAQSAAKSFMSKQVANGRLKASAANNLKLVKAETSVAKPTAVDYYIFNADKAYVVVAGDDQAPEILMYGEEGTIDINNVPPAMQWLLNKYKFQIDGLKAGTLKPNGYTPKATTAVAPLTNANWDQNAPYWNHTPTSGGTHTYTGCPATSLSMCFYIYKWPTTYPALPKVQVSGGVTAPALSEKAADWSNIIDEYTGPTNYSASDEQKDAVAWLMRYVGQACNMQYTTSGSGAYDPDILEACHTFGYTDAQLLTLTTGYAGYNQNYTDAQWNTWMLEELHAGRPIEYLASDRSAGGHAFNVFGCDSNGKYYVNWGWSGEDNGYCTLHNFTTGNNSTGQGGGSYTFNYGEAMIIGIAPPAGALGPNINVNPSSLSFSASAGNSQTKTIAITGSNLTSDVTVSLNDPNDKFSISVDGINATINSKGNVNLKGTGSVTIPVSSISTTSPVNVNVTFKGADEGTSNATLTIASDGAETKTISLKATVNDGNVPDGYAQVTLTVGDVWGDGSGYQMLLDADHNAYGTTIPTTGGLTSSGNATAATYAEFEYKIPENADGALTTQNIVINASVTILIPAGTYDWCITNPTPGDRIWIASTNGNVGGRQDDFEFESGKSYEFIVSLDGENDRVDVNPVGLPTIVSAEPTATTSEVTWTPGENNDSWNLRWRPYVDLMLYNRFYDLPLENDSYVDQIGDWYIIDADGDGTNWGIVLTGSNSDNISFRSFSYSSETGDISPDNWLISPNFKLGGTLKFKAWNYHSRYQDAIEIYVSTNSDWTSTADFVKVGNTITPPKATDISGAQTYTIDLSGYSGVGCIAFRHNSSACWELYVDDIELNVPNGLDPSTIPAWNYVNDVNSPYTISGLTPETTYEVQVQGVNRFESSLWTESTIFTTLGIEEKTLAEIEGAGVNGMYKVKDQLIAVDYRQVGENDVYLWCKDQGNASITPTTIDETMQIDFMIQDGAQSGDWDQSNWVILKLTGTDGDALAANAKGKYIEARTVTGIYDASKYMIDVEGTFTVGNSAPYDKNVYCTSNFIEANLGQPGAQTGQNAQYYFFMNPKIQEVCHITYAMWNGEIFTVPATSGFAGELAVDYAYNTNATGTPIPEPTLTKDEVYEFDAFVGRSMSKAGGYVVYPANLTGNGNIITSINTVNVNGEVVGVEYVNSLGVVSKRPFSGINIVVTRYSDGSATTVKKVFK